MTPLPFVLVDMLADAAPLRAEAASLERPEDMRAGSVRASGQRGDQA